MYTNYIHKKIGGDLAVVLGDRKLFLGSIYLKMYRMTFY